MKNKLKTQLKTSRRQLASRADTRPAMCLWNPESRSTVWWEGSWPKVTTRHPDTMQPLPSTVQYMIMIRCTISHCKKHCVISVINVNVNSIELNMPPPNNPDLYPVLLWLRIQETVHYCRSFKSVQQLKSAIATAWKQLSQAFLDRSISKSL